MDPQILKSALIAGPNCLSADQLERFMTEPASNDAHLSSCARCQAELAMLKAFESDTPLPDEGAAVAWISSHLERRMDQIKQPGKSYRSADRASDRRASWWADLFGIRGMRWALPVAAIAIVAVSAAILLRNTTEPELRAGLGTNPPIYRSQEVVVITPSGELAAAPTTLEWKAFAGATSYKVSLMEVDRSPVWTTETQDFSVTIPATTRATMLPGKPLLWQVSAVDGQGRVLATSQVQRFSVGRKSPGSGD